MVLVANAFLLPCLLLQVTPESLLLHYFSNRPGLWPIVVGVLKGMSNDYFKLDLKVGWVADRSLLIIT